MIAAGLFIPKYEKKKKMTTRRRKKNKSSSFCSDSQGCERLMCLSDCMSECLMIWFLEQTKPSAMLFTLSVSVVSMPFFNRLQDVRPSVPDSRPTRRLQLALGACSPLKKSTMEQVRQAGPGRADLVGIGWLLAVGCSHRSSKHRSLRLIASPAAAL